VTVACPRSRAGRIVTALLLVAALTGWSVPAAAQTPYVPDARSWEQRTPDQVGLDPVSVQNAVAFAIESESTAPRDLLEQHLRSFGRDELMAPVLALTGPPGGTVRVRPAQDAQAEDLGPSAAADERLAGSGTLWGKPDWADRPRGDIEEWKRRGRHEPGTRLHVQRRARQPARARGAQRLAAPLPDVLKRARDGSDRRVPTWRWFGYDNSWVVLDGRLVQSVSGGAHWGGGMFISARDMARFGCSRCAAAAGATARSSPRSGSAWPRRRAGVNSGAYGFMNYFLNVRPAAAAERTRSRRSFTSAPATTSSTSIRSTISSSSCAGSRPMRHSAPSQESRRR
jgi:hypothetical protein